jgi:hypothetical protein
MFSATVAARFREDFHVISTCQACDGAAIEIRCVNERGPQVKQHLRAADHNQLNQGVDHGWRES